MTRVRRVTFQALVVSVLAITLCHCEPFLNNQYGPPGYNNGNYNQGNQHNGIAGNNGHDNSGHYDEDEQSYIDNQPKSYEFGYAVKDSNSGNDFGRRESSDGHTVRGEYRVQLPDGRTQIVTYTADWKTGFHADVRYEGTAQYPDQYNTNNGYNNNNGNNGYQSYQQNNYNNGYDNNGRYNNDNNYYAGNSYQQQQQQHSNNNYNNLGNFPNAYQPGYPPVYGPPA